jgi:hypothetical protein
MIVAQPLRGVLPVVIANRSVTMSHPTSARSIERLRSQVDQPRLEASPLRGLRGVDIPDYAYWIGGGLLAGVVAGAAVYYLRK